MKTALKQQDSGQDRVLHLGLELSDKKWKLGFGDGERRRLKTIGAGDLEPGRSG